MIARYFYNIINANQLSHWRQGYFMRKYHQDSLFFSESEDENQENMEICEINEIIYEEKSKVYMQNERRKIEGKESDALVRQRGRPKKTVSFETQVANATNNQSREKKSTRSIESSIAENRTPTPKPIKSQAQITEDTLHCIYFEMCDQIDYLVYKPSQTQSRSFDNWIFTQIIQDLKYRQSLQQVSSNSTKTRTSLIKTVIQDFLRRSFSSIYKKQSQRITCNDKKMFEIAKIEPPPSSLNNQYIAKLFLNQNFKNFFVECAKNNRIKEVFLKKCYEEVIQFCEFIQILRNSRTEDSKKCQEFKKTKKPMTLLQVRQYELEASKLLETFCK